MGNVISERLARYMKDYLNAESDDLGSLFRFKDEYLEAEASYLAAIQQKDKYFYRTIKDLQRRYRPATLFEMAFDCMEKIESNKLDYKGLLYEEIYMVYYLYAIDDYQKVNELILMPDNDDKKPAKKQKVLQLERER